MKGSAAKKLLAKALKMGRVVQVARVQSTGHNSDPREDPKSRSPKGGSYKVPFSS